MIVDKNNSAQIVTAAVLNIIEENFQNKTEVQINCIHPTQSQSSIDKPRL